MVVSAEALHNCIRDQDRNDSLSPNPIMRKERTACAPIKKMTPTAASVNPNKALWEKGDFTEIAAFMRYSGEAVVKTLGVSAEMRVLDLGCGDGTTALPLARTGAEVTGIDIAPNLVAAGNKRAKEAGLTRLKFREGDACNLVECVTQIAH